MSSEERLWDPARLERVRADYATHLRYAQIEHYRSLSLSVGPVPNLFYGDSLTGNWPLQEFFPHHSILNRGIGGDSLFGLRLRLEEDVLAYSPQIVFMLIGINDIWDTEEDLVLRSLDLANRMRNRGIRVALSSLLPLRSPDKWDRFKFQDKIVEVNRRLARAAEADSAFLFLDYHAVVRDASGQLDADCAMEDGTHLTFEAYRRMAVVVRPHLVL
jgi:lysophospholipase L1-like esterase